LRPRGSGFHPWGNEAPHGLLRPSFADEVARAKINCSLSDVSPHIHLLEADRELAALLPAAQAEAARQAIVAPVIELAPGPWLPPSNGPADPAELGYVVLEGLLIRDIELVSRRAGELLGRGDVLRPSEHDGADAPLPFSVQWTVVEPTRVAVLDRDASRALAQWPELTAGLLGRAIRRAQWLSLRHVISQLIRVDARLLALFWHMADRWGHVEPEGVVVPLRLTHETLARLVGAQRPSVTLALGELADRELVVRRPDRTWRLSGDPPRDVAELAHQFHRAGGGG
jgi:CRP-like cAMP-binding protein